MPWNLGSCLGIVEELREMRRERVPLMSAESLPESRVDTMASQWAHLNDIRASLTLAEWIDALKAFSIPVEPGG
jgi:hypothetical protein